MYTILIVGTLLVIVSFLQRKRYSPYIGFFFVFLIMGFESGVEGDFVKYMDGFNNIARTHLVDSRTIDREPILPLLFNFFSFFGPFWFFILCKSFFQCYILVHFVDKYAPKQYRFFAAILFYFTFNLMMLQMHAIRQGLAIEIALCAFITLDESRRKWPSLLLYTIAFFTHNSVLVLLPFYFLFYWVKVKPIALGKEYTKNKVLLFLPFILISIYLVLYYVRARFLTNYFTAFMLLGGEDGLYSGYVEGRNTAELLENNYFDISPLIVLYDGIIVFLASWYYKFAAPRMRTLTIITIVAAFGDMLFFGVGTIARIIMYYNVFNIVVYPAIALEIKRKFGGIAVLLFFILLLGYAIKTSYPWISGTDNHEFGNYRLLFMP